MSMTSDTVRQIVLSPSGVRGGYQSVRAGFDQ